MLRAENLCCGRHGVAVLRGVSLTLQPGQLLGVLGANGAGKSTLLATLAGELPAMSGSLTLHNQPLSQMRPAAQARCRGVLPQSPSLAFELPVRAVVGTGAYPFPEVSPAQLEHLIDRALVLADASHLASRRYTALSGGEQQRIQFARVLTQVLAHRAAGDYRALLLDEPTASLDPKHQWLLLQTVAQLARDEGLAVLVILHDVNLAAQWCDQLLLLAGGSVVAHGPPDAVLTPAAMMSVYGMAAQVVMHPVDARRRMVCFVG
ncbi:heme ABC transporter ATP-binding protein [Amantichitinum ursilacus]|uniref:Hemin import ATP-binding protein HmuV n=1 Tax=Amantichitinum ursilacus TaxID=857265 RepID=A0A0N1JTX7_9NEIS|nr:heme ABC transporter ATP-binding protein [Amantichitinum ursilacus]KPC55324.1 Hemin import ATP-binding protein HmuV [Amantichitinum ursilacus]